jgi:hypothetical protein
VRAKVRWLVLPVAALSIGLLGVGYAVQAETLEKVTCVDGVDFGECRYETIYLWDSLIAVAISGATLLVAGALFWRIRGRNPVALAALLGGLALTWWPLMSALIERAART